MLKRIFDSFLSLTIGNPHFQLFGEYYYRIPTLEKVVALTFDDGPVEPYTRELLNVLDKHRVKATFFFVGKKIETVPGLARLTHQKGHQLGNHSYSHSHLYFKSFSYIRQEIEKTDTLLRQIGFEEEIYFRSPYGQKLIGVPYVLRQMKKINILFDFFSTPRDWVEPGSEKVAADIIRRARPGSILLLHDGNKDAGPFVTQTADQVIRGLKSRGFEFKTVFELLKYRRMK